MCSRLRALSKIIELGLSESFAIEIGACKAGFIELIAKIHEFESKVRLLAEMMLAWWQNWIGF